MDFNGKKVVITGGSRGIGKKVTEEFKNKGAKVAVGTIINLTIDI